MTSYTDRLPAFRFQVSQMDYPAIYEPQAMSHPEATNRTPKYGVTFPLEEFPQKIIQAIDGAGDRLAWMARNQKEHYRCDSMFRPLLTEISGNYAPLTAYIAMADLRNISRDRLFRGIPAELIVRPYWGVSSNAPKGFFGLSLEEVIFDIAHVHDPEMIGRWDKGPVL